MKTVNLKNLVANDKFNAFWFTTENGEYFASSEVEVEDTETVNILFSGYVGKDPDGFDKWVVEGKGEGFTMKGSFYNEEDYNDFVETNTKI